MGKQKSILLCVAGSMFWCACSNNQNKDNTYWETAPVVAQRIQMEHGELIDFKPELLQDTIVFPLSYFCEEPVFVKLEDSDEALISSSQRVLMSDNYFLIMPSGTTPCKLFDKKGKFVATIGQLGGGPGEYNRATSSFIDEENQRIYIASYNSSDLLIYNFSGKSIGKVTLPWKVFECYFQVEKDRVKVVNQPNRNPAPIVWSQNLEGTQIDSIMTPQLALPRGLWSMGITVGETEDTSVYFMTYPKGRSDSLYHVDFEKQLFIPRFTMDMSKLEKYAHVCKEWPRHFVGSTSEEITTVSYTENGEDMRVTGDPAKFYIVDKKTLKGAYLRIEDDYKTGIELGRPIDLLSNKALVRNLDPGNLAEALEKVLGTNNLPEKTRNRLTTLYEGIGDDSNNYIMYARMK